MLQRLIKFWYPESFIFFARLWHNTLSVLEEDLAVGLMVKLLFVPLFHDASPVGRLMSFIFRLFRIALGGVVFAVVSLLVAVVAALWFLLPATPLLVLSAFPVWVVVGLLSLFLFGIALFIHHIINKPLRKVWQIRQTDQVWQSTKLTPRQLSWDNLMKLDEVTTLLKTLEVSPNNFRPQTVEVDDGLLVKVLELARRAQAKFITPVYFWVAMLAQLPGAENELLKLDLKVDDFVRALEYMEVKRNRWRKVFIWDEDFAVKHLKGTNRGWLGAPTPALDSVSLDLTRVAAREGFDEFIGRQAVVTEVVNILSQDRDRNVLLIGEPGSGRSALVNHLARLIITGDAPEALATKRLVALDLTKLVSGVSTEGDLAERVRDIFDEVKFTENIIIYVDQIHNMGIGDAGNLNLYGLMTPFLESGSFQFIASTETSNYARVLEKNSNFARVFHKVELMPATPEETISILENRAVDLCRDKKIQTTFVALKELVEKSKFVHDRVLPDSALAAFNRCVVQAKDGWITVEVVRSVLSDQTNIPLEVDGDKSFLLHLEDLIHKGLIDQEEAVTKVADALRRSAASIREEGRPIGSFLFVGPSGVGKTELAKILAKIFFKDQRTFVRFDMSEYQTVEALDRLIGTLNNPGELTEVVKNKPYCLLLLDEFEKANPQILNLFLQVLEDGRLTSGSGQLVDFTNTIIIATSNAASVTIAQSLNKMALNEIEAKVKEELLKLLKPELLNRFDEVVIFKPLSKENLQQVVLLKLEELKKLLHEQGYLVEFGGEVVTELASRGFDPVLGARPLRRLIQDTLEARLSRLILENKLPKGEVFRAGVEFLK